MKIKNYFFKRFQERSFWVGVSLAVSACVALPYPWNFVSLFCGIMGSLVPDGKINASPDSTVE